MRVKNKEGSLSTYAVEPHTIGSSRPVKVGLVQINNSFSGACYFPYSVGLLQSYVQHYAQQPARYEFLLPIYSRTSVAQAVEQLLSADIVGFSTYVWNIRLSLEIARHIKLKKPETLIVFGGPQMPDRSEEFLCEHQFIDIACHGEGETVFLNILEHFPINDWEDFNSISYLDSAGAFVTKPKAPRITDLSVIPSPYLDGVFAPLMERDADRQWLVLWETNRGCPFSCTFCDWGSAVTSKVYRFEMNRLLQEIEWFADNQIEFIFCCDANFGILPRDREIAVYAAKSKEVRGYPQALSVQNTKNATERAYEVQKILNEAGLNKGVTISLQSVSPTTLEDIKRKNIKSETFQELQRRFTRDRVETYSDLILGLPGETYESFADGVAQVIDDGQHNRIQFGNLSILPNAEMGDPAYQKQHGMIAVKSKIINIHGALTESTDEIPELQDLVIATKTMPREDWRRTRAFAWMTGFLHFNKVFQIPMVVLREVGGVGYRDLIEAFADSYSDTWPVLAEIQALFIDRAKDIQEGGPEYYHSDEWLNIWWPIDEYAMIKLCTEDKLCAFYAEAEEILTSFLQDRFIDLPAKILQEAIRLNCSMIKLPFQTEDLELSLSYNIWDFYQSILVGEPIPLEEGEHICHIDRTKEVWSSWGDWCREVVWYGNKKGAYLYGNKSVDRQLAGHY
jgi:tRNA A37 methylthiotransferase MiaB